MRRCCGVTFRQVILLLRYIALRNFTAISVYCYHWLNRDKSFSIQSDKKKHFFSQSGIVKVSNCPVRMCNGYDSMLCQMWRWSFDFHVTTEACSTFSCNRSRFVSLWFISSRYITACHAMTQYMSCHIISSRRYLLERQNKIIHVCIYVCKSRHVMSCRFKSCYVIVFFLYLADIHSLEEDFLALDITLDLHTSPQSCSKFGLRYHIAETYPGHQVSSKRLFFK